MKTTIVLLVSREEYLNAIFARLELLTCDREKTNLLCMVDGSVSLYLKVRNKVDESKFFEKLCVEYKTKKKQKKYDSLARRIRISDIHNLVKTLINDCDYIFCLEDDTIFPINSLEKLIKNYSLHPYAGFIQGVQLGRWGIPYVGAWKVDNIYEPKKIESLLPPIDLTSNPIQEIDAGGFYCFLTKKENYISHEFNIFENNTMGPDFNFGLELRKIGMVNYIDWSIKTIHKTEKGEVSLSNSEPRTIAFTKKDNRWRQSRI